MISYTEYRTVPARRSGPVRHGQWSWQARQAWTDEREFLGSLAEGTIRSRSERRHESQDAFNPRNRRNDAEVTN